MTTPMPTTHTKALETDAEYEAALALMGQLMSGQPAAGSEAVQTLESLAVLVRDYESTRYRIEPPK